MMRLTTKKHILAKAKVYNRMGRIRRKIAKGLASDAERRELAAYEAKVAERAAGRASGPPSPAVAAAAPDEGVPDAPPPVVHETDPDAVPPRQDEGMPGPAPPAPSSPDEEPTEPGVRRPTDGAPPLAATPDITGEMFAGLYFDACMAMRAQALHEGGRLTFSEPFLRSLSHAAGRWWDRTVGPKLGEHGAEVFVFGVPGVLGAQAYVLPWWKRRRAERAPKLITTKPEAETAPPNGTTATKPPPAGEEPERVADTARRGRTLAQAMQS